MDATQGLLMCTHSHPIMGLDAFNADQTCLVGLSRWPCKHSKRAVEKPLRCRMVQALLSAKPNLIIANGEHESTHHGYW
jgi:hypothetical protein